MAARAARAPPVLKARLPMPSTMFRECPIEASLGALGRKWALVVLRDVAWFDGVRFSDILRLNPGLTPRVLTFRLKELRSAGLIERLPGQDRREVAYRLTPKGEDVVPILGAFMQFGARHHARTVFGDGRPRAMGELFSAEGCAMLGVQPPGAQPAHPGPPLRPRASAQGGAPARA